MDVVGEHHVYYIAASTIVPTLSVVLRCHCVSIVNIFGVFQTLTSPIATLRVRLEWCVRMQYGFNSRMKLFPLFFYVLMLLLVTLYTTSVVDASSFTHNYKKPSMLQLFTPLCSTSSPTSEDSFPHPPVLKRKRHSSNRGDQLKSLPQFSSERFRCRSENDNENQGLKFKSNCIFANFVASIKAGDAVKMSQLLKRFECSTPIELPFYVRNWFEQDQRNWNVQSLAFALVSYKEDAEYFQNIGITFNEGRRSEPSKSSNKDFFEAYIEVFGCEERAQRLLATRNAQHSLGITINSSLLNCIQSKQSTHIYDTIRVKASKWCPNKSIRSLTLEVQNFNDYHLALLISSLPPCIRQLKIIGDEPHRLKLFAFSHFSRLENLNLSNNLYPSSFFTPFHIALAVSNAHLQYETLNKDYNHLNLQQILRVHIFTRDFIERPKTVFYNVFGKLIDGDVDECRFVSNEIIEAESQMLFNKRQKFYTGAKWGFLDTDSHQALTITWGKGKSKYWKLEFNAHIDECSRRLSLSDINKLDDDLSMMLQKQCFLATNPQETLVSINGAHYDIMTLAELTVPRIKDLCQYSPWPCWYTILITTAILSSSIIVLTTWRCFDQPLTLSSSSNTNLPAEFDCFDEWLIHIDHTRKVNTLCSRFAMFVIIILLCFLHFLVSFIASGDANEWVARWLQWSLPGDRGVCISNRQRVSSERDTTNVEFTEDFSLSSRGNEKFDSD